MTRQQPSYRVDQLTGLTSRSDGFHLLKVRSSCVRGYHHSRDSFSHRSSDIGNGGGYRPTSCRESSPGSGTASTALYLAPYSWKGDRP